MITLQIRCRLVSHSASNTQQKQTYRQVRGHVVDAAVAAAVGVPGVEGNTEVASKGCMAGK